MINRSSSGFGTIVSVVAVSAFLFGVLPFYALAADATESINLSTGWNIVSTPRLISGHSFSVSETSSNFDIFILNAAATSGWSTMADLSQSEFSPLYGYFINNKSGSSQTLTFTYKSNPAPNERLFQRTFSKTGWYSLGAANATYARTKCSATTDVDNVGSILNSLNGKYSAAIDFTDDGYANNPNSVAVGDAWKAVVPSDINALNDFRELKGYAVYITGTDALYSGFQNITAPQSCPASISVIKNSALANPSYSVGLTQARIASFSLTAGSAERVSISSLAFDKDTDADFDIQNVTVKVGGTQFGSVRATVGDTETNMSFSATTPVAISAGATVVVDVYADIQGTTASGTHTSAIDLINWSAVGGASGDTITFGASVSGQDVIIGITTPTLTAAANSSLVAPTYISGSTQAKLASFVLTASSEQSVRVSSLTFDKDSNVAFDMQNMTVKVGSTQFGTTRSTIGDAETSLAFSAATTITVAAGGSVTIDVYADILTTSTAATHTTVIDLTGWTALGSVTGSSVSFGSAIDGQNVIVASGPTLTLNLGSNTAPAKNVVMGSTNNELFTIRLTADNIDDIRITDLIVNDSITGGSTGVASFQNATLWDGSTMVAGPLSLASINSTLSTVTFALSGSGVVIPKNGSKELTVRADVPTFSSGGAVSGSSHIFKISANTDSTVTSVGSPTATVTVTGAPVNGNAIAVYRTKLTVTATPGSSSRSRQLNDDLGTLNFSADSSYQVVLGTVTIKLAGTAVSNGSTAFTVDLIDTFTGVAMTGASQQTCTPGAGNSCSVTFNPSYTISAGTTKNVKVRVNSSSFYDLANNTENLTAVINSVGDVRWSDGTTSNIALETTTVPVTIIGGAAY